jgi:transcriptional regulator with XRE-family HTH domain
MADGSPTVRRRRLGLILRGLREKVGLTGEEVGAAIERSGSWVSRVETGRVGLRSRDLNDLLSLYRVDDATLSAQLLSLAREGKQRGWWSRYADTLTNPYAAYIGFEAEAAEVLIYESVVINGLLQTEDYARALFTHAMIPPQSGEQIEKKVKVRHERQGVLARDRPLKVWAILDESVLYRRIGGNDVHRAQLKHLLELSELPNITIQVIPFDAGPHPGIIGSFTLMRFPLSDDPEIVYMESLAGDIFVEAEDAVVYRQVFDHLRAAALSPIDSRQRIGRTYDDL